MAVKIQVLLAIVALAMVQVINVFAIEPPDRKQITDEDKLYFGTKLDMEQVERLVRIIKHEKMTDKSSCDKVTKINKTLRFMKEMTPIFWEASKSADVSSYTRKYSAELAKELSDTSKALNEILPRYKETCAAGTVGHQK